MEKPDYEALFNRTSTGLSFPPSAKGMQQLETLGIVREITGQQRNRVFAYQQYLSILNEGTETS